MFCRSVAVAVAGSRSDLDDGMRQARGTGRNGLAPSRRGTGFYCPPSRTDVPCVCVFVLCCGALDSGRKLHQSSCMMCACSQVVGCCPIVWLWVRRGGATSDDRPTRVLYGVHQVRGRVLYARIQCISWVTGGEASQITSHIYHGR